MSGEQRRIAYEKAVIRLANTVIPELIREMQLLRGAMDRMPRRPR